MKSRPSQRLRFAVGVMDGLAQFLQERLGAPGLILIDPLAATVCLSPELVTQAPLAGLAVETNGAIGRGLTAVDWLGNYETEHRVHIITELDQNQAFDIINQGLQ